MDLNAKGFSLFSSILLFMLLAVPLANAQTVDTNGPLGDLIRVFTFQDYNTRVVVVGTTLLGLAAGLIGTFLVLRKRALLSDTLSHATLPGIALAFIVMTLLTGDGKQLLALIVGAAIFAVFGTASVLVIQRFSRLKDDAALGIVLSVYFGLGIALMGMATRMDAGNAAGLSSFIYGKTASMLFSDALLIAITALVAAIACLAFFKEFSLICFDADFGQTQGWPVTRIDLLMMTLVVLVTVIGLQAVGLILVVALLIIPAASARFWTHRLRTLLGLSGLFGALSGFLGSGMSALMANLPAGAVIVLVASFFFLNQHGFRVDPRVAASGSGSIATSTQNHERKSAQGFTRMGRDHDRRRQAGTTGWNAHASSGVVDKGPEAYLA